MSPEQVAWLIFDETSRTSCTELRAELFECAIRYAHLRARWALASRECRIEIDPERTRAHNVLIDACNILSRAMARAGEPIKWRRELGDERGGIGDVACHIHCKLGLLAR